MAILLRQPDLLISTEDKAAHKGRSRRDVALELMGSAPWAVRNQRAET
jgi:hypothetical protein